MQNEFELKKLMCEIGRRVYNRGMVAANDLSLIHILYENDGHLRVAASKSAGSKCRGSGFFRIDSPQFVSD